MPPVAKGGREKILAAPSMGEHGKKYTVWEIERKISNFFDSMLFLTSSYASDF